jgi:LynF/TruF/PatF family peptide O-prenyltransferase
MPLLASAISARNATPFKPVDKGRALDHRMRSAINSHRTEKKKLLLRLFDLHCREYGLQVSGIWGLFRQLLVESPAFLLECSVAVDGKHCHPARLRAGYRKGQADHKCREISRFLQQVERLEAADFNRTLCNRVFEAEFDYSKIALYGIGLDVRSPRERSKVKCYFMIEGYRAKAEQIWLIHNTYNHLETVSPDLQTDPFIFALDLYFNGDTGIEVYPRIGGDELTDERSAVVRKEYPRMKAMISQCMMINVSFDGAGKKIIHFYPKHPARFIRGIDNPTLQRAYGLSRLFEYRLSKTNPLVCLYTAVSAYEEDIVSNNEQRMNLYYSLRLPEENGRPAALPPSSTG